jgi:hypothetical protein
VAGKFGQPGTGDLWARCWTPITWVNPVTRQRMPDRKHVLHDTKDAGCEFSPAPKLEGWHPPPCGISSRDIPGRLPRDCLTPRGLQATTPALRFGNLVQSAKRDDAGMRLRAGQQRLARNADMSVRSAQAWKRETVQVAYGLGNDIGKRQEIKHTKNPWNKR